MTEQPTWPAEPGWRVRTGAGLLAAAPLSAELAEAHRKEDERERLKAERDRELRAQAAAEHVAELRFQGREPRTPAEVFADQAFAEARQDAAEARRAEANADFYGKPRPSTWRKELAAAKAEREAHEAELEATPASKGEFDRLKRKLQNTFHNLTGKNPGPL